MLEPIKPTIYYPEKSSLKWTIIGCLAFIYIGFRMEPDIGGVGYAVAALFAIIMFWAVIQRSPRTAYLRIDADGFTYCHLFREKTIPWSEVDHFVVTTLWRPDEKAVACILAATTDQRLKEAGRSGPSQPCEKKLPDNYGMTVERLAAILNESLQKARGCGGT